MLTTKQAATRLGIGVVRVNQLIRAKRLAAEKFGRDYLIKTSDLAAVRNRKPGRPKKGKGQ